ncbi:hypothetical protein DACRYDRAFT_35326, partial [Dacryopinax primogenitus]
LTEAELLAICGDPAHPAREHGLYLKQLASNEYNNLLPPYATTAKTSKQLKRASTISVMSGLGGGVPELPSVPRSPSNTSFLSSPKSKITSFFTRRPPSELITNNLKEYFPDIEKKNLSRAARHSIMR